MMENTNETNFNEQNIFVDSVANNVAEQVNDSNDFYDDEVIEQPVVEETFDTLEDNDVASNPFESVPEEPVSFDAEEVQEEPVMEKIVDNEEVTESVDSVKPLDVASLTNDDMDKMIAEDAKKPEMDDSYVLSNFDVLFDSLYNDVNGANNFISNLIEQKKTVNLSEANVNELTQKLEKEKEDFAKYIEAQKQGIEAEKQQCNEYIRTQKARLKNEEEQFNADMDAARAERKLAEESLKIERENLESEKEQFAKEKEIEEEKLNSEREKLTAEKEQFAKEKEIELGKIKNAQKDLQAQRDQFAKAKELEEKKLELESKNLSQSCARFKELVSQFNSGFQQLPEDK